MGRASKRRERKQQEKSTPKRREPESSLPPETQAAEALTVAWSLSVVGLTVCDIVLIVLFSITRWNPEAEQAHTFYKLLLQAASIMAIISLFLLPFVRKMRKLLPPVGFTIFAIIVALIPFVVALAG